jgi:hypothetical protein
VILQMPANVGLIYENRDIESVQQLTWTNTRKLQQFWRVNGARADYDLAPGQKPAFTALVSADHGLGTVVVDNDFLNGRVGENLKVWPLNGRV